jgi:sporulation protein YlmC with PRC-barrel domain
MLRNLKSILGYSVIATDSYIGELDDILFDDRSWKILYGVVDVGDWLLGRKVLLPPSCFEPFDRDYSAVRVRLSRQEVEESPDIDAHMPVSRQHRMALDGYYGWCGALASRDIAPRPFIPSRIPEAEEERLVTLQETQDPCLRSAREVLKYHTQNPEGDVGRIDDFLFDDARWEIVSLVVDTRRWLSGTKALISPWRTTEIAWNRRRVMLQ